MMILFEFIPSLASVPHHVNISRTRLDTRIHGGLFAIMYSALQHAFLSRLLCVIYLLLILAAFVP